MQRSEHLCQQQLRVSAAVWGHYAEVQVLASVLSPNDPQLKAYQRDVRQKLILYYFMIFLMWEMLFGMSVWAQQSCYSCLLFHHLTLSACLFAIVCYFFLSPLASSLA